MLEETAGSPAGDVSVSRRGVLMHRSTIDEPVAVRLDDQWVWSFQPVRDSARAGVDREVRWPKVLVPHLRGRSQVVLVGHTSGTVLFDDEVAFTPAERRVSVVDRHGNQLAVDKGGRLQRTFDETDRSVREFIVEKVETILRDLREQAGLDAFLAFGCLLGAVRDGKMIGHDADADVGYLSKHEQPLDIIRENRAAVAVMRGLGYRVVEMSAADFKIWVELPGGRRCGVDVFGGYHFRGDFYMLPTVRGKLARSSLLPTSTVVLEGREIVAPARPEDLLEVTYGPHWRVPDPSFKYEHPRDLVRHMDGYWRGARNQLRAWGAFYKSPRADRLPRRPSPFARWVQEYVDDAFEIVDVGAGTGRDAIWFARQGRSVVAMDYIGLARTRIRRRARRTGLRVKVRRLNLYDVRSTLLAGTRLAHDPRPRHVYARMLLDGMAPPGRVEFYRFSDMVTRRGGLTFIEFRSHGRVSSRTVIEEITARGGTVELHEEGRDLARTRKPNPAVCRLVVRWTR